MNKKDFSVEGEKKDLESPEHPVRLRDDNPRLLNQSPKKMTKKERLALALRENLRRRKVSFSVKDQSTIDP